MRWLAVLLLLGGMGSCPGAAQTLELRVVEDSTRAPLAGVVVRVFRQGKVVASGLSDQLGRLVMRLPAPGTYHLRGNRIGHEGSSPEEVVVEAGSTLRRVLVMPNTIRILPTITVRGDATCLRSPGGGTLAAALWEEVRTALDANRITADQGLQVLHAMRFERDLTPGRQLLRERLLGSLVTTGQPFVSLPAEELARRGFVYQVADTVEYFAPDAASLLADDFVNAHCFRVQPDPPSPSLVGLSFEPVNPSRRADVRGTLWIDRVSRELRYLEFQYTGLPEQHSIGNPGGEIHFRRLSAGAWIVREWFIRMPRVGERRSPGPRQERYVLTGWVEQGGRTGLSPPPLPGAGVRSAVEGVVFDSLHLRGLPDALVTFDGEPDSVRTRADGTFRVTVLGQGPRLLRVSHSLLGLVSDNSTQEIELRPGQTTRARVDVPPAAAFSKTLCAGESGRSMILGIAYDSAGVPELDRPIRASWFRDLDGLEAGRAVSRSLTTRSGARGMFAFCDLPSEWSVRLNLLNQRNDVMGQTVTRTRASEAIWVDLRPYR